MKQIMEKHEERMKKIKENDYAEDVISLEKRRECEPEIEELEWLIDLFEEIYSLDELNSIADLTVEEASKHPVRAPARKDLIPIDILLKTLERETNIAPKKYEELKKRYANISRAVGIINKNKVEHNR